METERPEINITPYEAYELMVSDYRSGETPEYIAYPNDLAAVNSTEIRDPNVELRQSMLQYLVEQVGYNHESAVQLMTSQLAVDDEVIRGDIEEDEYLSSLFNRTMEYARNPNRLIVPEEMTGPNVLIKPGEFSFIDSDVELPSTTVVVGDIEYEFIDLSETVPSSVKRAMRSIDKNKMNEIMQKIKYHRIPQIIHMRESDEQNDTFRTVNKSGNIKGNNKDRQRFLDTANPSVKFSTIERNKYPAVVSFIGVHPETNRDIYALIFAVGHAHQDNGILDSF